MIRSCLVRTYIMTLLLKKTSNSHYFPKTISCSTGQLALSWLTKSEYDIYAVRGAGAKTKLLTGCPTYGQLEKVGHDHVDDDLSITAIGRQKSGEQIVL